MPKVPRNKADAVELRQRRWLNQRKHPERRRWFLRVLLHHAHLEPQHVPNGSPSLEALSIEEQAEVLVAYLCQVGTPRPDLLKVALSSLDELRRQPTKNELRSTAPQELQTWWDRLTERGDAVFGLAALDDWQRKTDTQPIPGLKARFTRLARIIANDQATPAEGTAATEGSTRHEYLLRGSDSKKLAARALVAEVRPQRRGGPKRSAEAASYARQLLAASPKLLEALTDCLEALEVCRGPKARIDLERLVERYFRICAKAFSTSFSNEAGVAYDLAPPWNLEVEGRPPRRKGIAGSIHSLARAGHLSSRDPKIDTLTRSLRRNRSRPSRRPRVV